MTRQELRAMTSGGRGHQKRPNAIAPEMDVLDDTPSEPPLTKEDYTHLADMRHALRAFARQTELELRTYHVSPQQYLLLLAIKGFPGRDWANITELAERLQIRHNAVIGLVNRAEKRGFVKRIHDPEATDRRVVHVRLTPLGERMLGRMVEALRAERVRVQQSLGAVLEKVLEKAEE